MNVIKKSILTSLLACCLQISHASTDKVLGALPLKQTDGKPAVFTLAAGKITVINFWATWCAPCRKEMPILSSTARLLAGQPVRFVGIALDQPEAVEAYLKASPVSYPVLLSDGDGIAAMKKLGNPLGGLPFTVIVDPDGKPLVSLLGEVDRTKLDKALAKAGIRQH